jgi:hypothetical protein
MVTTTITIQIVHSYDNGSSVLSGELTNILRATTFSPVILWAHKKAKYTMLFL